MKRWLQHVPYEPYAYPLSETKARIVLYVACGKARSVTLQYGDRYDPDFSAEQSLVFDGTDGQWDYFVSDLDCATGRLQYRFAVTTKQALVYYGEFGMADTKVEAGVFQIPYFCVRDLFMVPMWVSDAVAYQIFPDRFARLASDKVGEQELVPWDSDPKPSDVFGGTFAGIMSHLTDLQWLGVTVIYLTPVFKARSSHKYDTEDYFLLDPQFGTQEEFRAMVQKAHELGIRIVLDAVFNHVGIDFPAFQDVIDHGMASPYWSWFFIEGDHVDLEAVNYKTFANHIATMPKLHVAHLDVEAYLLRVGKYWITEFDIDGWRLDVANEVDHVFWRKFRTAIKEVKSDALIIGEVWHDSLPWLRGDQFDGVMNYVFRESVLRFFVTGRDDATAFMQQITRLLHRYPVKANQSMFNLLGSHDTERVLTMAHGDVNAVAKALIFQFTYPGIPMIYYGDEIGMEGAGDPDCRRGMLWDVDRQNKELQLLVHDLASLRKQVKALQGARLLFSPVTKGLLSYDRVSDDGSERVTVLYNHSKQKCKLPKHAIVMWTYPVECVVDGGVCAGGVVLWRSRKDVAI